MEESEEHDVELVEAGEDSAESLEPAEESLDLVAAAIKHSVGKPLVGVDMVIAEMEEISLNFGPADKSLSLP